MYPGEPGLVLPHRYIFVADSTEEAMGVNVVQVFVCCKYGGVTGANQLPICIVDVIRNVFNEILCSCAACGFDC